MNKVTKEMNAADWFKDLKVVVGDGLLNGVTKIAQIKGTNDLRACSKNSIGEVHFIQTLTLDGLKHGQEVLFNMDTSDSGLNLYTDFKTQHGSVWFSYPKPTAAEFGMSSGDLNSNTVLTVPTNDLKLVVANSSATAPLSFYSQQGKLLVNTEIAGVHGMDHFVYPNPPNDDLPDPVMPTNPVKPNDSSADEVDDAYTEWAKSQKGPQTADSEMLASVIPGKPKDNSAPKDTSADEVDSAYDEWAKSQSKGVQNKDATKVDSAYATWDKSHSKGQS